VPPEYISAALIFNGDKKLVATAMTSIEIQAFVLISLKIIYFGQPLQTQPTLADPIKFLEECKLNFPHKDVTVSQKLKLRKAEMLKC